MQLVERPWGVTAFGADSVKALPDLVRVRFKIVRVEQTPSNPSRQPARLFTQYGRRSEPTEFPKLLSNDRGSGTRVRRHLARTEVPRLPVRCLLRRAPVVP